MKPTLLRRKVGTGPPREKTRKYWPDRWWNVRSDGLLFSPIKRYIPRGREPFSVLMITLFMLNQSGHRSGNERETLVETSHCVFQVTTSPNCPSQPRLCPHCHPLTGPGEATCIQEWPGSLSDASSGSQRSQNIKWPSSSLWLTYPSLVLFPIFKAQELPSGLIERFTILNPIWNMPCFFTLQDTQHSHLISHFQEKSGSNAQGSFQARDVHETLYSCPRPLAKFTSFLPLALTWLPQGPHRTSWKLACLACHPLFNDSSQNVLVVPPSPPPPQNEGFHCISPGQRCSALMSLPFGAREYSAVVGVWWGGAVMVNFTCQLDCASGF